MKIIVSFCNVDPLRSSGKNLAVIDVDEDTIYYLSDGALSFSGIVKDKNYIYAAVQDPSMHDTDIYMYDINTYEHVSMNKLVDVVDAHSMLIHNDKLHIVSTGTDAIVSFQLPLREINYNVGTWYAEGVSQKDTLHMNALGCIGDVPHVAMFGIRNTERWSSAMNGSIVNVYTREVFATKIYHPHSLVCNAHDWYICESSMKRVLENGFPVVSFPEGYVRGLAVNDYYLVAGMSSGRKNSKSLGIVNNAADPGDLIGVCKVCIYRKGEYVKVLKEFNFSGIFPEIYDIIFL